MGDLQRAHLARIYQVRYRHRLPRLRPGGSFLRVQCRAKIHRQHHLHPGLPGFRRHGENDYQNQPQRAYGERRPTGPGGGKVRQGNSGRRR